jgi:hypothetical protein
VLIGLSVRFDFVILQSCPRRIREAPPGQGFPMDPKEESTAFTVSPQSEVSSQQQCHSGVRVRV